MLYQARNPRDIHRSHPVLRDKPRDKSRKKLLCLRFPLHGIVKINRNLEQSPHIGIERRHHVVKHPVADKDDLHIQRYCFRLQRRQPRISHRLTQAFDLQPPGLQASFQALPRHRLHQKITHIDDQKTAICLMKTAATDHPVVGHEITETRPVLDPTE